MRSAKSSVLFFRQIAIAAALLAALPHSPPPRPAAAASAASSPTPPAPSFPEPPSPPLTPPPAPSSPPSPPAPASTPSSRFLPALTRSAATAKGFDTVVQKNVPVTVDQVTTINLTLKVGQVSEVVTVTETTSLVDTSNSTVGQLISADTIDRVPLLTRNVYDLIQLSRRRHSRQWRQQFLQLLRH